MCIHIHTHMPCRGDCHQLTLRICITSRLPHPFYSQSVSNIISHSADTTSGGGSDLFLTFTFVFPHPEVQDDENDEEEAKRLEEKYLAMAREVVQRSVEVARRMKVGAAWGVFLGLLCLVD